VPLHLRNAVTSLDRALEFGAGYRYAHDQPGGLVEQQHLPDELIGRRYYEPGDQGAEHMRGVPFARLKTIGLHGPGTPENDDRHEPT
jgi:putative ATPase